MALRFDPKARTVREITVKFEANDGSIEDVRVRYFSPTVAETRRQVENNEARRSAGETVWLSDSLANAVESIPDLVDGKGKPHKITPDFLESISIANLMAIDAAIREDLVPKLTAG